MSIASFLARLWAAIKKMFQEFDEEIKAAISIGVQIVENIKNYVESPAADILAELIPGELDDQLKSWLRQKLPEILLKLKLAEQGLNDDSKTVTQAVYQLKTMDTDIRYGFFHNLSILIAQIVSDGKLNWEDGVYILQWYYQHQFKKN